MVSGVGPLLRKALIDHFGSVQAVLCAPPSRLKAVAGIGQKVAEAIAAADQIDVQTELELCRQHAVELVLEQDAQYPRLLREIPDPPGLLYCQGSLLPQDALAIAMVGTRHATSYGLRQAERLSGSLARAGLTIVSGMARGIDQAVHWGALRAGGRTIALLAGGLLNVYPPDHHHLTPKIVRHGSLISENPLHGQPVRGAFPRRNRLITGMSLGVVVVEASHRSGALISARHAMEQGREVFAVPGQADSRASHGCHQLLRDGAKLVETADDVLEELGPLVEAAPREDGRLTHHPAELQLNEQEQQVLDCIAAEPTSLDQITLASGLPIHRVLSTISVLEMRHLIRRTSGQSVSRR
jgi:DNA processing protein